MEIRTFGVANDSFGELSCNDVKDFQIEELDYERTALVSVEDEYQRSVCFIFNPDFAKIKENDLMSRRKEIAFTGSKGMLAWFYCSSYFEAEIFSARPVHLVNLVEIVTKEWKNVQKMHKKMRRYANKYNSIKRYTEEYFPI